MDGDFEDEENHVGLSYQLVIYFKISSEDPYSASLPTASPEPSPTHCKVERSFLLASAAPGVKQVCKNQNIQQIPRVPGLGKRRQPTSRASAVLSMQEANSSLKGATREAPGLQQGPKPWAEQPSIAWPHQAGRPLATLAVSLPRVRR